MTLRRWHRCETSVTSILQIEGDGFQVNKGHLSEITRRWGIREELRLMKEWEQIDKRVWMGGGREKITICVGGMSIVDVNKEEAWLENKVSRNQRKLCFWNLGNDQVMSTAKGSFRRTMLVSPLLGNSLFEGSILSFNNLFTPFQQCLYSAQHNAVSFVLGLDKN